jgi:hypothetical protein
MNPLHQKTQFARGFAALLVIGMLAGCGGAPVKTEGEVEPQRTLEKTAPSDVTYAIDQNDPIEGFNRGVYHFNAWVDRSILLPVVGPTISWRRIWSRAACTISSRTSATWKTWSIPSCS